MKKIDLVEKISLKNILKCLALLICFISLDVILRMQPRMQSKMQILYVSVLDEVPILYDILYGVILVVVISGIADKIWKKIIYIIVYTFLGIYMLAEYIYCGIFDKVFGVKALHYIEDAKDFSASIISSFDVVTLGILLSFMIVGILGYFLLPDFPIKIEGTKKILFQMTVITISVVGIVLIPAFFKKSENMNNSAYAYMYKKYVYQEWIDNKRSMEMFGAYEFLGRDFWLSIQPKYVSDEDVAQIDEYFSNKEYDSNEMTGIFKGKNIIVVLMESIDDWIVNQATMPTICKLMKEGIVFENMYTPIYGAGATINSEFCSYTGMLSPTDGTPLISYSDNSYLYALPNLFEEKGYSARVLHYNSNEFYERKSIHPVVGFDEYISYLDYEEEETAELDTTLLRNEKIYQQLIKGQPFFSYVITYTAHSGVTTKPYSHDDIEIAMYPEYIGMYEDEAMDGISAKARITDDMFAELLMRLEEDGILEDTVILGFGDHYNYIIHNQDYLKKLSNADNSYELSKTPMFIWAKGLESQKITKVVNTMDIYPTLCNLFALDNQKYYLGNDCFDEDYKGYVFWQDGSWISSEGSYYSSTGEKKGNVDENTLSEMQSMITEKLRINQLIYKTDYFSLID